MSKSVIVVGGGIIGLSTAWELVRRGDRVTLLERSEPGQESSWAGAGILSALLPWQYGDPVNRLIDHSLELYDDWIAQIRSLGHTDPEYRTTGMLVRHPGQASLARQWLEDHGHVWQDTPQALQALAGESPGLWLPDIRQVRNPRLMQALLEAAGKCGLIIHSRQEVVDLILTDRQVTGVRTPTQSWHADQIVLTSGAWTGQMVDHLPLPPPIRPMRGQMLLFQTPPGTLPCIVHDAPHYLVPRADGLVLAGSTVEDRGFDKTITESARESLHAFAAGILPELGRTSPLRHWSGLRPGSPDNIPCISRHPTLDHLYINAGHFRYGVTMAPASAKLLADLLHGHPPGIDPNPYRWPADPG